MTSTLGKLASKTLRHTACAYDTVPGTGVALEKALVSEPVSWALR